MPWFINDVYETLKVAIIKWLLFETLKVLIIAVLLVELAKVRP